MDCPWLRVVLSVLCALVLTCRFGEARGDYRVQDVGRFPGGTSSSASAINALGQVVGWADTQDYTHAFRTQGQGPIADLGVFLGGWSSEAKAINKAGEVVGNATVPVGSYQFITNAFRTTNSGVLENLGTLSGWVGSHATGVNDSGQIVGYGELKGGLEHAFLASAGGAPVELGSLGGDSSRANGINDAGQVVGSALTASGQTHAFLSNGGKSLIDLGALPNGDGNSYGTAINGSGLIVGYAGIAGNLNAVEGTARGGLVDIGTLSGMVNSFALAVNDLGQVVGSASDGMGDSRAFLYTPTVGMIDLNALLTAGSGWVLTSATGINDLGQITGNGLYNGQAQAFLLTPEISSAPEPASLVLMALGVCGLIGVHALRQVRRVSVAAVSEPVPTPADSLLSPGSPTPFSRS